MTAPVESRCAARVLVVDPQGQVLMVHGYDPHNPHLTYWFTIGGGVDEGEDPADAAVREMWEETGQRITRQALIGPVHRDEVEFPFEGRRIRQQQVFYGVLTDRFDPEPAAFEDTEVRSTVGLAWLDPDALAELGQKVYPPTLADLVRAVRSSAE
jgi:8-oxo-dGTP pyrophosphatase MutT (NUDIX family)